MAVLRAAPQLLLILPLALQQIINQNSIPSLTRWISLQLGRVTILLNKPIGFVSGQPEDGYRPASFLLGPTTRWAGDRAPTRFERAHLRGLAPAGRLDIDSTGLLVLTQDGRVAKQLVGEDVESV